MPIYDNNDRLQALRRALKMNMLFADPNFDNIMHALGKPSGTPARFTDFETACTTAGLNSVEIEWLWNYLQHVDNEDTFTDRHGNKVLFKDNKLRDAAQTGW